MHKDGRGYSTITSVRNVIKPAFQMAYDEDIIRKNPFDFKLSDLIPNNTQKRVSMTNTEQKIWIDFIKNDKTYCKYYDEFVVLPHITPHVFRHTFCTNMANAGMEVKTLQYLMGHSDVSVTLNVYTHSSYEHVKEQMEKVMNLDVINLN